jgi:hypothetical protein
MTKIKRTSDKIAPKKFKQVIYLRKGKPTKGKADAKKVNKQTRKQRKSMQQKLKQLRNSKDTKQIIYI